MVAIVLTGSLTLRSSDVGAFLGFLGSSEESTTQIQTYSQRTVLTYIGARIFAAHPLTGVGWQGSELPAAFEPFLDDARKRFPDVSVEALPSRSHPWGVQNAYVQAAADMGVLGLAALVTVVVTSLWLALRIAFRPLPPASFALGVGIALLVCAMELAALGLVPGVPATALLWLGRRWSSSIAPCERLPRERRSDGFLMSDRHVLVTGGAGFIGSNLVRELLARGDRVRVLDNFSTGNRDNLAPLLADVEVVEGDLRSYERVHAAVRGTEIVFHQGALPSVPRSVQDPLTTSAVNIEGTLNVLLAARDEAVRRVVNASSSSVYGSSGVLPRTEDQAPDPISPYAVAKLAAERFCTSFSRVYDIEAVSLRYFNVFGPRQDPSSQYAAVLPRFIRLIADGRPVTINGDGEQSRDFTFVDNVVDANLRAAEAAGINGASLNVATGVSETINRATDLIAEMVGRPAERTFVAAQPADVRASLADISEARRLLGYEPAVAFADGLRRTIDSILPDE